MVIILLIIKLVMKPSKTTDESNDEINKIATHNDLKFDCIKRASMFGAAICLDFDKSKCAILYQGGASTILGKYDVRGSTLKFTESWRNGKCHYQNIVLQLKTNDPKIQLLRFLLMTMNWRKT